MHSTVSRFAIAALASLAMATSANADTILQFTQQIQSNTPIALTDGGGNTITTTGPGSSGGSVPVNIFLLNSPVSTLGFETFTVPLTTGPTATVSNGVVVQTGYSGTIKFSSLAGGAGTNILTAMFTGGILTGSSGGNSANFSSSQPPSSVTFTSDILAVQQAIAAGVGGRNFSLAFSGLTSSLTVTGGVVNPFFASNTGTFATAIPEPTSIVMASIATFAGLGCFGWRHFKRSQA